MFRRVGRIASSKLLLIQNDQKRNSYHIHHRTHASTVKCDVFFLMELNVHDMLWLIPYDWFLWRRSGVTWSGVTPLPCVHPAWTFHNMLFSNPSFNQSIFECDIEFLKASSHYIAQDIPFLSPFHPYSIPTNLALGFMSHSYHIYPIPINIP